MREFWAAAAVVFAIVCVAASAGVLMFLGAVIDPVFWRLAVVLITGAVTGGTWIWWRDRRAAGQAAPAGDDTEVLDREAIANHQPAAPRVHRFDAAWWRDARRRVRNRGSRIKESAR